MFHEVVSASFILVTELTNPMACGVIKMVLSCTAAYEQPFTSVAPFIAMGRAIATVLQQGMTGVEDSVAREAFELFQIFAEDDLIVARHLLEPR